MLYQIFSPIYKFIINLIGTIIFYNKKIKVIGVTGTNGKTTTTYLIKNYLEKLNKKCGLIGTEIIYDGSKIEQSVMTTPGTYNLIRILLRMFYNKCEYCSMEVSSHAIGMKRIDFIDYDAAILTNISLDHIEYHKTVRNYVDCKTSFLQNQKVVILNMDDLNYPYINTKLKSFNKSGQKIYTYGTNPNADFIFSDVELNPTFTTFKLFYENFQYKFKIDLLGLHNVYNFVACLTYLVLKGYNINELVILADEINPPEGRLEQVYPNIFVDYAHTPVAVGTVISYFRQISSNKIIVVFGTGGREGLKSLIYEKRKLMAEQASNADFVIVTSDNSKHENPNDICNQLFENINHENKKIILDRYEAIKYAINNYPNCIILVLGKGNETIIKINNKQIEFNDKNVIKQIINNK